MPRYFYHCADGYLETDHEGIELPDLAAARLNAVVFAGETLRDDPKRIWDGCEFRVAVTDETGLLLFTVTTGCAEAPSNSAQ